jgi:hypothetical protein
MSTLLTQTLSLSLSLSLSLFSKKKLYLKKSKNAFDDGHMADTAFFSKFAKENVLKS